MIIKSIKCKTITMHGMMRRSVHLLVLTCYLFFGCTGFFASKMIDPIANSETHQMSYQDLTMYYYTVGDKTDPPLVFLHGILAFTEAYSELIEKLSERFYVIGIDLRGHGRSTIASQTYSHKLFAEDVIRVVDEIGLDRFHVVGHSAGGFVLLSIGKYFPNRMIKGVSIASLYNHEGIDFQEKGDDYLTPGGFRDNQNGRNNFTLKIFDSAYETLGEKEKFENTKKIMMEHRTEMFPSYTSADLMDIKTPILVIVAENDRRIKPDHTIQMANLLPNSRMELVNGAAHFGIIKRKKTLDVVVEHIFDFLK